MPKAEKLGRWWGGLSGLAKFIVVIAALVAIGAIGGGVNALSGPGEIPADKVSKNFSTERASYRPSTTIAPAPPTAGLYIVKDSLQVHHNSIGYLVIEGKVGNRGSRPLKSVKLRAYALDDSDATVNTEFGYIHSDILAPGTTSTFEIFVDDPDAEATSGRVVVESAHFAD
jgi:hypothetical protein